MKGKIGERSSHTNWLVDRLREAKMDELLLYRDLAKVAGLEGEDEDARFKACLRSARRILLVEDGKLFGTIRKEGVKWLADGEVLDELDGDLSRGRRLARRGMRKSTAVQDANSLDQADRARLYARQSYFAMLDAAMERHKVKKLEDSLETREASRQLNWDEMLDQFRRNDKKKKRDEDDEK